MILLSSVRKASHRLIKNSRHFESLLAKTNSRFRNKYYFESLVPPNENYSADDVRICNRNGITYRLSLNDYQQWLIYFNLSADSSLGLLKYVKMGDFVFDVGGNIGQTALELASKVGRDGRVFSFEPFPTTLETFKNNAKLNARIQNLEIIEKGLGENESELQMYRACTTNSGANRVLERGSPTPDGGLTSISITTLDNFVEETGISKIDLIKIDVEGYEMKVLRGGQETLRRFRPQLYIEVNDENLKDQGDGVKDMFDFLKSFGYSIFDAEAKIPLTSQEQITVDVKDIYCQI